MAVEIRPGHAWSFGDVCSGGYNEMGIGETVLAVLVYEPD
jgi:hypothetical protein